MSNREVRFSRGNKGCLVRDAPLDHGLICLLTKLSLIRVSPEGDRWQSINALRLPPGGSKNKALYQLVCGHDVLLRLPTYSRAQRFEGSSTKFPYR